MRIVVRSAQSKEWKLVESADYDDEAEMQKLLAESPSLIPMDEIREGISSLVVAIREFGLPGSGTTDLLAFSADGDIALIECKLAANQDIKRKVVGQILEYASYLWRMRYEEVDERVYQRTGQRLADMVAAAIGTEEWDEETFRSNVADALGRGSFILVIAVDEINEELGRTIEFLNLCTSAAFSFNALEMRRFQEGETERISPGGPWSGSRGCSSASPRRWPRSRAPLCN
jgi:hypothetical protein